MAPPEPSESEAGEADSQLARRIWLQHGEALSNASCLLVAFSGGLDSSVLLSLLCELRDSVIPELRLEAVHVNHGLQAEAAAWEAHCRQVCESMQLPFHARRVKVDSSATGTGLEAAAREARYAVFRDLLPEAGLLLQGHHLDDQSETLLLHLLRGSGARGLAGIPAGRPLGRGRLLRPLLRCERASLLSYARARSLVWIEDPSNADPVFDRNYLRQSVLPLLKQRWPAVLDNVARSASLFSETEQLLEECAAADLQRVVGSSAWRLALEPLRELPEARQRNVLRYWIRSLCGDAGASMPFRVLHSGLSMLLTARSDGVPALAWGRAGKRLELRRFQGELYLLRALPEPSAFVLDWQAGAVLQLPPGFGSLHLLSAESGHAPLGLQLQVRLRRGGEVMRLRGRGTKTLKNLLQENKVPPWLRERIPLVFDKDELLVVPGLACSEHWEAHTASRNVQIVWQQAD